VCWRDGFTITDTRGEAFVDLNCAGLTRDLLETELFGHERGPSPERFRPRPGFSRSLTKAPSFSTKSAMLTCKYSLNFSRFSEEKQFRRLGTARSPGRYSADAARIMTCRDLFAARIFEATSTSESHDSLTTPPLRDVWRTSPILANFFLERLGQIWVKPDGVVAVRGVVAASPIPGRANRELRMFWNARFY